MTLDCLIRAVDDCQVGVFLGYAGAHGHTLVDRRLYLTEGWLADPAKRTSPRAAVPSDDRFRTKLELAAEMLGWAAERDHLPCAWVIADAAYGDSHDLRRLVAEQGRWYCFEVSRDAQVWTTDPDWRVPPRTGRIGRPRTRARPSSGTPETRAVEAIVRELPAEAWIRHHVTEGKKGPREYEFVRLRVVEKILASPLRRAG